MVRKSDGSGLSPYDLKRLQVGLPSLLLLLLHVDPLGSTLRPLAHAPPACHAPSCLLVHSQMRLSLAYMLLADAPPACSCATQLQAYANSLVDHHLILDLVPPLAANYFAGRLPAPLSYSQAAILAAVGLQQHEIGKVGGQG